MDINAEVAIGTSYAITKSAVDERPLSGLYVLTIQNSVFYKLSIVIFLKHFTNLNMTDQNR